MEKKSTTSGGLHNIIIFYFKLKRRVRIDICLNIIINYYYYKRVHDIIRKQ